MSKKKEKDQSPAQLFDNSFKFIMTEASTPAVVHLINGLYKKSYPPDTVVKIEPNESIKKHPKSGNLGKIVSDIVVTLFCQDRNDTYLIEAQIDDDMEMSLRIFNYSVQIALKRKKLAAELAGYVNEIAEVLHKSRENCYITDVDVVMLKDCLSNMHSVLYGGYEELTEVDMTLKQMHESSSLRTIEKAEAKAEIKGEKRGISLGINQGVTQVAKAMKASGEAISKIMSYTGLSRREIAAL
ncbi:MAG: hypothetical protein FWC15_00280 [Fibromonadales bacterium]|nr:hypothetical protein [Fibromonadales bacterium]